MSMMECFFSIKYAGRSELFEDLSVWNDEIFRKLQGTFPVIFVSFAGVKANNFRGAKDGIIKAIANAYNACSYVKESGVLTEEEKSFYDIFQDYSVNPSPEKRISDLVVTASLQTLALYMERLYSKKVLIFLDEYDTPLQEAYISGYWDELAGFVRELFNLTFKENKGLDRAIMTGITRVSKESIFSDLNNLEVVTTTSDKYCESFGFTEDEVNEALNQLGRELCWDVCGIGMTDFDLAVGKESIIPGQLQSFWIQACLIRIGQTRVPTAWPGGLFERAELK